MRTALFDSLKIGDRAEIIFGGGMEGRAIGVVIRKDKHVTDFTIKIERDFYDSLSRRRHLKDSELICHAKELKAIISP